ncbi:MAG: protein kinase, partial [Acidobacteria bacterium]|nr:protein kinase [Acidobacteriota bacterium]
MLGKTISHYKVIEKIGQGGMGEVYRAKDTTLDREVAIKVLPEQFTQDPQRLARFEREAKLLASLNHPNIAAIYGFEHSDSMHFLVLELVPGETLAERVAKGPLPVEEALEVCRQIAEGMEAAHEKGVIHRDLKPANVKVTPEGKVKILDFGLAKAFEAEPPVTDISQSPTLTEEMTRAGVILGTAAYMSPEQAKGEAVDKRADIFAFGCVLYELLTGKRTFDGKTITETLGAIIHKEPEWKALPASTPWRIQELLRRCLTKDAHERLRDIAHVRVELNLALYEPAPELPTGMVSAAQPTRRLWAMAVGLVVLTAVVAGLGVWLFIQPSSPEQTPNRFVIRPSPPVLLVSGFANEVAISPDGRQLVYMGVGEEGSQFYLRSLNDFVDRPIPVPASPNGIVFFSPDSKSIGFFADNKLKKISLAGGSPITLCDVPGGGFSGDWFEDTIVFIDNSGQGLYRVSANGGEPEMLATANLDEDEQVYVHPEFLPDGKDLLFTIRSSSGFQTALLSLETGERKVVLKSARQARYLSTGHLVYEQSRTGNLRVVPFDLAALEVTGDSVPVVQGVRQGSMWSVDYAISDNGTLVYVPSTSSGNLNRTLVWVDRKGQEEPLAAEPQSYQSPRISPDGSRLAITIDESGGSDVWIYDLEREILTRLTFDPAADHFPVWAPDGQRIVFDSGR